MIAVDFSFERPSIQELQKNGVAVVIRYLTGAGKSLSATEVASYRAAGIVICVVFEVGVNDIAGGASAGHSHAQQAVAAVQALKMWPMPIYFAVDEDVDANAAVPYFQGINAVLPWTLTGVYGEGSLLLLLQKDGLAAYHWLSESTGFPGYQEALNAGIVHLQQKYNASPIPGTDLDLILKADIGQWPRPTPVPPTPIPTPTPPPAPKPPQPKGISSMYISADPTVTTGPTPQYQISGNSKMWIPDSQDWQNLIGAGFPTVNLSAEFFNSIPTVGPTPPHS